MRQKRNLRSLLLQKRQQKNNLKKEKRCTGLL